MPIFEFRCADCGHVFEKLYLSLDENVDFNYPECGCQTLDRVLSQTNYVMGAGPGGAKPKLTEKSCSGGNKCFTLDLPGPTR